MASFIKQINLTGIEGDIASVQQFGNLPIADVIPAPDAPLDIPPAEPLEGAGRFRVLSHRILKQQPVAFKRFL